jgi:chorismate synthase
MYNDLAMLRFLTAGESHGQALVVVLDGMPAGLPFDEAVLTADLRRRQGGYGRGRRMAIESDTAEVLSGVRKGETLGGPIALLIRNRDWTNWQNTMHVGPEPLPGATGARRAPVTRPRPGHADLAGALKYEREDMRDILERASARETTARVAAGAVARQLLARFGIEVRSHVFALGGVRLPEDAAPAFEAVAAIPAESPLRCVDSAIEQRMVEAIDRAREAGDTLGGAFEVIARGVPVGLGSHVQWDRKLDGRLAQALMSIHAIKGVGIGLGTRVADLPGSQVHDEILLPTAVEPARDLGVVRPTNRAGGLEGGITNGEDVRVSAYMKPIATLMKPLRSVDLATGVESPAAIERSDVCAVSAAGVIGEAMVCLVLADAFLEKFGGDSVGEIADNLTAARTRVRAHFTPSGVPAS